MKAKKILFAVMCSLLALVIILSCVVAVRVSQMFNGSTASPESTGAPSTEESTTVPTEESTAPSQTTAPTETDETTLPTTIPTESTAPTEETHVHDFVLTDSVTATCTTYGYNIYTCACGKQEIPHDEQVSPLGHNFGAGEVIEASCEEAGCTRYTCSRCGIAEDRDVVNALGHNYEIAETVDPSCSAPGFTRSVCAGCGDEILEEIESLVHSFEPTQIVDGSCTEDGYTLYVCGNCGQEEMRDIITASGHELTSWKDGSRSCVNCDLVETHQDLYITNVLASGSDIVDYKLYRISIGTDYSAEDFVYYINDYINNGTLTYHYDTNYGLVITYQENGDIKTEYLPPAQSESAYIYPDLTQEETTAPTAEPSETPETAQATEVPETTQVAEVPETTAPTEPAETEQP